MPLTFNCNRGRWLFFACGFALVGCADSTKRPPPQISPAMVSYPVQREVTDFSTFTGRTEAVELVEVRARVGGFLEKVLFVEGGLVKKGQPLFVIDQRPFHAELNRAKAQREQAEASVSEAQAKHAEVQAQVPKVAANLEYNRLRYERSQGLAARNALSRDELELHHSEFLQAKATSEAMGAQVAAAQAAIGTAVANVAAAKTAVEIAELNFEYTKINAPISGRISRALATEGNLVQSSQQGTGGALTTIVSVDPIYVYFDVDERTVLKVRHMIQAGKAQSARDPNVKLPVRLGLTNEVGFPHQGTIDFIDNQINPRTGTLRVRGVFPNPYEILSPGLFARVQVPIGQPHSALLISERALDSDQGQKIVYVVDENNQVVTRPVRTGALHDGLREIEEGLKPRDQVIVTGLQSVRPGITVKPKLVSMPGSEASESEAAAATSQGLDLNNSSTKTVRDEDRS